MCDSVRYWCMRMKPWVAMLLFAPALLLTAQTPAPRPATLKPLSSFNIEAAGQLAIGREVITQKPFSVIGPRGAILGQQDGSYEAWIFPWKILSNMRITAEMKDYPVPIDVNQQAAFLDVQPDHTTITFSHANFTVREILFTPQNAPDGAGALAFYQVEAVRPMTLTFSFTPEMLRMWPALSDDRPSPEWVKAGDSGFYMSAPEFPRSCRRSGHAHGAVWDSRPLIRSALRITLCNLFCTSTQSPMPASSFLC